MLKEERISVRSTWDEVNNHTQKKYFGSYQNSAFSGHKAFSYRNLYFNYQAEEMTMSLGTITNSGFTYVKRPNTH